MRRLLLLMVVCVSSTVGANTIQSRVISDQLNRPWSVAFLPNNHFLVTERGGTLRIVDQSGRVSTPIKGLPKIAAVGQGGLLDVILHPDFKYNNVIYLSYVAGSAVRGYSTEVLRATLDQQAGRLNNVNTIFIASPKTKGGRHFGSRLLFDNNGYLYISLGDRGVDSQSQDLTNHHGSIIRLHDNGDVPQDNPWANKKALAAGIKPEIFSYGHRNIQGLALHPSTGQVWAHEHGPQGGDELNHIVAGKNYGWPIITYGVNYGTGTKIGEGTKKQGLEQPEYYWDPSIAPSGLAYYNNAWFIGALKFQLLAKLTSIDGKWAEERFLERKFGRIRDVKVGLDSNNKPRLYLLTDAKKGRLIQLSLN